MKMLSITSFVYLNVWNHMTILSMIVIVSKGLGWEQGEIEGQDLMIMTMMADDWWLEVKKGRQDYLKKLFLWFVYCLFRLSFC